VVPAGRGPHSHARRDAPRRRGDGAGFVPITPEIVYNPNELLLTAEKDGGNPRLVIP
jgi:hypothetical protein